MTDALIAVLTTRLETLEEGIVKHEDADDRRFKYSHNMLEDLLTKLASLERDMSYYDGERLIRGEAAKEQIVREKEIFERLRTLERMAWLAIGSTGAFGAIVTYFGQTILHYLAK